MANIMKFLDWEGVKFLWSKINIQDYPNNQTLINVINAIDETKADKTELESLQEQITELKNNNRAVSLVDQITGVTYYLEMRNGELCTSCAISSITVTKNPDKMDYKYGETFDPTGMVVTATYADGSTKEVTGYTCSEIVDNIVTITYIEGSNTLTTTIEVTVKTVEDLLVDFEYTNNGDGTYTITDWKETYNGEASTEMIIPDNSNIIL